MQIRHRIRQRIAARRRADSEWIEGLQRSCCCAKDPDAHEHAMSVHAEVTLIPHEGKPINQKTLIANDCGRTFDFADFECQYANLDDSKDSLRNLYSVCFPRPELRSSTIEIALNGADGFKKQRLGTVKCSLKEIFWNHDEVQTQSSGEPKQIDTDSTVDRRDSVNTGWLGHSKQQKRLSLVYEFVSKGKHVSQFAGSVKCGFTLSENQLIVDFLDAQELRDLDVPVDLSGLDPFFCAVSVAMLFVYFLVGMSVFSHVPMSSISAAMEESCGNDNGTWGIVETAPSSEWEAPSPDRIISSFYFCVVVFTSVGFGDIIIIPDGLRVFTIFFVLWGTVTLGFMLHLGSWIQEHLVFKVVALKRRCTRKKPTTIVPEGSIGHQKPKMPDRKQLLWGEVTAALVTFLVLILMGMFIYALDKLVFQDPDPSKSAGEVFVNMLYFSVISCTTIGFGDETPNTTGGRLLAGIFLLVALPVFGNTIAVLTSLPTTRRQRRAEENVLSQFGKHLSCDELRTLIYSAGHKGESCTRAQFLLHILLKQAKVTPSEVKSIGKFFDTLDDDNSGFLDIKDVDENPEDNKTKSPCHPKKETSESDAKS